MSSWCSDTSKTICIISTSNTQKNLKCRLLFQQFHGIHFTKCKIKTDRSNFKYKRFTPPGFKDLRYKTLEFVQAIMVSDLNT